MDAILGVKGIIIILINIQGFLWWRRKSKGYRFHAIKALLFLSSGLVSLPLKSYLDRNVVCVQIPKKGSADDVPLITDQPVLRALHFPNPA